MGNSNNPNSQKNQDIKNRELIDQQRQETSNRYNDFLGQTQQDWNTSSNNSAASRASAFNAYSRGGGSTGRSAIGNIGSDGFSPGGGSGGGDGQDWRGDLNDFMDPALSGQGGWFNLPQSGPVAQANVDFSKAKAGYGKLSDTGGVDTEDFNNARAGYADFARTGGVDAQALRNRATAVIPSFYDSYKKNLQRRAGVQGGYSPGFDAQAAEIGRQAGREGFQASRQVEGDIADKVQQGRMFGIAGQRGIGETGLQGTIAGLGGLTNIGGLEGENARFNAGQLNLRDSQNLEAQLKLQDMRQRGLTTSAEGRMKQYEIDSQNQRASRNDYLGGLGGLSQNDINNLQLRLGTNNAKGIDWAKWAKLAGGVGLMAASPWTGGATAGPGAGLLMS